MKETYDAQLKNMEGAIRQLDGRFVQQGAQLHELRKSITMLRDELNGLRKQMEAGEVEAESVAAPSPPRPKTPGPLTLSAEEVYEHAYTKFLERDFQEAINSFQSYVDRFPQSELADNAQYWIGESHQSEKRFEDAVAAYQLVIDKFPKGNKVPDAILRKGLALSNLDENDAALKELYTLIELFPASDQATRARKLIAQLRPER